MKAFIGFDYIDHFRKIVSEDITPILATNSIEPVYPLIKDPGGDLLYKIFQMIDSCSVSFWECTTVNPNVIFELGYTIGKKYPFYILYSNSYNDKTELPNILKTQWGIWYNSIKDTSTRFKKIGAKNFPKGNYNCNTNEFENKQNIIDKNANSIALIIDSNFDYEKEISILNKYYENSKIHVLDLEYFNSIYHLQSFIESSSTVITILNPVDEEPVKNVTNAVKLLGHGIAIGLNKDTLLFQKGMRNFADTTGLAKNYEDDKSFLDILEQWNLEIIKKNVGNIYQSYRINVPNYGKLIERNRIVNYISQSLFDKPVFLMAPSGYGKSSIVLNLINSQTYPVIWYTFDSKNTDITLFIKEVIIEISKANDKIGKSLNSILASYGKQEINIDNLINYFISELKLIDEKTILILDDIHLVAITKGYDILFDLLLSNLVKNVAFIILSREELAKNLGSSTNQTFLQLGKKEIEFNEEEIKQYFVEIFDIKLEDDDLKLLTFKSEGWIASIVLLRSIFAEKGKDAIKDLINNLRGTNIQLYDYFANIVFSFFPSQTQNILKLSSLLNRIDPYVLSFLTNITIDDCLVMLNALKFKNSFLFNFLNEPNVYKYHTLFKEFLIRKLEESESNEKINSFKQSLSDYYLNKNEYFEAIEFALESRKYNNAVEIISKIGNNILNEGYSGLLNKWFDKIPDFFYEDMYALYIIKGRAKELEGYLKNALISYNKASSILNKLSDENSEKVFLEFLKINVKWTLYGDVDNTLQVLEEIIKKSKGLIDKNTYYHAAYLAIEVKRNQFVDSRLESIKNRVNKGNEEQEMLDYIDHILKELAEEDKPCSIIKCQILVSKAMISHTVGWGKALLFLGREQMRNLMRVKADKNYQIKFLKNFEDFFEIENKAFEEALILAKEEHSQILLASILVNIAQNYNSRNHLLGFQFGFVNNRILELSIDYYNQALKIYRDLDNNNGIALVYNNVALTYNLYSDKILRNKYANYAIEISRKFNFPIIERKALEILNSKTLEEAIIEGAGQTNIDVKKGLPEKDLRLIATQLIETLGDFVYDVKAKKTEVLIQELEANNLQHTLANNWCKYIFAYITSVPFSKHKNKGIEMIAAYIKGTKGALELYDAITDDVFEEPYAKFILCKKYNYSSSHLGVSVKDLSDDFIKGFCSNCKSREI